MTELIASDVANSVGFYEQTRFLRHQAGGTIRGLRWEDSLLFLTAGQPAIGGEPTSGTIHCLNRLWFGLHAPPSLAIGNYYCSQFGHSGDG